MKRSFSLFHRNNVFLCFLLAGFFILVGNNNATAQELATSGANPKIALAQKFGVTAYSLGTFDPAEAITVLQQHIEPLEHIVAGGGGTELQQATYAYLTAALNDISTYSIAPEITLLTRLNAVQRAEASSSTSNNGAFFRNLYNQIVSELL